MKQQPKRTLVDAKARALLMVDRIFANSGPVTPDEIQVARSILHESDRGSVLVAAAYVDEALAELLRGTFSANPRIIKKAVNPLLSDGMAPIKSLSARTKLSYALELIDDELFGTIECIRKLRNAFAHESAPASLAGEKLTPLKNALPPHQKVFVEAFGSVIDDWLEEIRQVNTANPLLEKIAALTEPSVSPERVHFASAFAYVYGTLQYLCGNSDPDSA